VPTAVLVGIALGNNTSDAGFTVTATYGGTAMTSLAKVHANNGVNGFIQVFGLAGPLSGPQAVAASVAGGTPGSLCGGSLAYLGTGLTGATAFGTPGTAFSSGNAATGSVGITGTGASNMVAAFAADGSGGESVTSGGLRYLNDQTSSAGGGAGNTFAADKVSAGSGTVSVTWSQTSDWWGAAAVELLFAAGTSVTPSAATGAGGAPGATTIPGTFSSGPNYPAVATDLGGGTGFWQNPFLAQGPP
jgi:hypothetical protein